MIKLNLGCGNLFIPNFIGIDMSRSNNVQIQAKLTEIPIKDNSVDFIYAGHVVEHIPISVLFHKSIDSYQETLGLERFKNEIFRILKPGCSILIRVPYKENPIYNIVHHKAFDENSFLYWCTPVEEKNMCLQSSGEFEMENWYISYLFYPFFWHINKYMLYLTKKIHKLNNKFHPDEFPNDGRIRMLFGFRFKGRELTVILRKVAS